METGLILVGVAAVFIIILGLSAIRIIRPFEKGLVERFGKFQNFTFIFLSNFL